MVKVILYFALLFFFNTLSYGQTGFPIQLDTTAKINLGYQKKKLWSLPLEKNQQLLNFKFDRALESPSKKTFAHSMPVHQPDGHHHMPVHVPDSTINYSMIIVRPENN